MQLEMEMVLGMGMERGCRPEGSNISKGHRIAATFAVKEQVFVSTARFPFLKCICIWPPCTLFLFQPDGYAIFILCAIKLTTHTGVL